VHRLTWPAAAQPEHPSSHPPIHPSTHPPIHPSTHPPPPARSPTRPPARPLTHPPTRPPARPPAHPPTHPTRLLRNRFQSTHALSTRIGAGLKSAFKSLSLRVTVLHRIPGLTPNQRLKTTAGRGRQQQLRPNRRAAACPARRGRPSHGDSGPRRLRSPPPTPPSEPPPPPPPPPLAARQRRSAVRQRRSTRRK
jgi:hypothetical protein